MGLCMVVRVFSLTTQREEGRSLNLRLVLSTEKGTRSARTTQRNLVS